MKRIIRLLLILYGVILLEGCNKQTTNEDLMLPPNSLTYVEVVDASENGKGFITPRPAVETTTDAEFKLLEVSSLEGGEYIEGELKIDSLTGAMSLENGHQLVDGTYKASVKVSNLYGNTSFNDVFTFHVLPENVGLITYTPNEYTVMLGDSISTVAPTIESGSKPFHFKAINNSFFELDSATGIIHLPLKSEIDAGVYSLSVTVSNASQEDVIAANAVKVNVESKPYYIAYEDTLYSVPLSHHFQIPSPEVKGTNKFGNTISYSLVNNHNDLFQIDVLTGEISLEADPAMVKKDDSWTLDVVAKNSYGEYTKTSAVKVKIADEAAWAPYQLKYPENLITVYQGDSFISTTPTVSGPIENIVYQLVDDYNIFKINATTGVIQFNDTVDPYNVTAGTYTLSVEVSNDYGATFFNDALTVDIISSEPEVIFADGFENIPTDLIEYDQDPNSTRIGKFVSYSIVGEPTVDGSAKLRQWASGWDYRTSVYGDNANYPKRPGIYYKHNKKAGKDYLVSDEINFTYHNNLKLDLVAVSRYGSNNANSDLIMLVTTNFTGDPETTVWKEVAIPSTFNSSAWIAHPIEGFDFNEFAGKKIRIAFKAETYEEGDKNYSRNYCINTIKITGSRFR